MSSRAWVIDLAHSIGEKTALADHLEEKLLEAEDEKEKAQLKQILEKVLNLRREQMSYLLEQAEKPNPKEWCDFKHAIKAFIQDSEVYEATLEDTALSHLEASGEVLAMEMSKFLGMEFEVCQRCLEDRLLVKQFDNNKKEK